MNSEKIRRFVHNGNITWTMTTIGYVKYTLNLVLWLKKCVKWDLCVICCDSESELFFRRQQIPCVLYKKKTQDGMAAFGTPSFSVCNLYKVELLKWFAENYESVGYNKSLYMDGDIVVQRDPWILMDNIIGENDKENIAFQCDCSADDEHFDCRTICSGLVLTRHVSKDQGKIYDYDKGRWEKCGSMDQPYIAEALGDTPFKILERRQFGNGTWMKRGEWKDGNWTLLHYNYLVSGTKRSAMKANGHWLLHY